MRHVMRRASISFALALSVNAGIALAPTERSAMAQQASTTGTATALFDEAIALMEKGKFKEACPKLARSNELSPNGGTLFALAECYESNGQIASAWITYKEASIRAAAAHREEATTKANAGAAKLEPRVARLTIEVAPSASGISGLTIALDTRTVAPAELGIATPIDPGDHIVEASAPKHKPIRLTVKIDARGGKQSIAIPVLEKAPDSASTSTSPSSPRRGRTQRILGLGMSGVGLVGVGLGAFFGLKASSKNDDADAHCRESTRCDAEGVRLDKEGRDAATISTISFIAGGVLFAGGIVLYLTAPSSDEKQSAAGSVTSIGVRSAAGGSLVTLDHSF